MNPNLCSNIYIGLHIIAIIFLIMIWYELYRNRSIKENFQKQINCTRCGRTV